MVNGDVRRGAWAEEEDSLLRKCIETHGEGKWHLVPPRAGLNRCRKSCRLRWLNYLRPNIKRGQFSSDEVDLIVKLHKLLGNRWSLIAGRLPGRTGNDVKNYWNTHQGKKCISKQEPSDFNTTKPAETRTLMPRIKVLKPRPRIFSRHNIETLFSSRVHKSTPIIINNNNNSDDNDNSFKTTVSTIASATGLFSSLFHNDGKEAGASWLEEEGAKRYWSDEMPTFVFAANDELGDGDNNSEDKHKTNFWENENGCFIDMDIWGLFDYTQNHLY